LIYFPVLLPFIDKGKPVEKRGRKAIGVKAVLPLSQPATDKRINDFNAALSPPYLGKEVFYFCPKAET